MSKKLVAVLGLGLGLVLGGGQVEAQVMTGIGFLAWYDRDEAGKHDATYWLLGLTDGYSAMNLAAREAHKELAYCQPEKLPLAPESVVQAVRNYIQPDRMGRGGYPAEVVVLHTLQDMFPCQVAK